MNSQERRLVVGVCIVLAAATVSAATFNYVVLPMIDSLDATESQESLLRQLPSIGSLLVIFLAGVVGPRVGPQRFVMFCGLLMASGYTVVSVSPVMPMACVGMLMGSIGQQGLFVVLIGLLSARLSSRDSRATGFAAIAAVSPVVYLIAPIVAGAVVDRGSWRVVIGLWIFLALTATLSASRLLPPDDNIPSERVELWTPALAGFALVSVVQSVNSINAAGLAGTSTLAWFAATVLAVVVLVILMRRLRQPSLDITVLRHGGFRLLLVAAMLVPFAGLYYYAMVGMQYVYGQGEFGMSLIMIPAQLTGLFGAWLSGRLIRRRGIRITGTAAMLAMSLALFLTATQTVTQPLVLSVVILCLYTGAKTATNAPMTNAIMNLAAKGAEGSAAAFRGAAGSLGNAVGVAIMSTIVFSTFQSSLTAQLHVSGGDASQVSAIAESLRSGVSKEQAASEYSVPQTEVDSIDDEQKQAMVDAYRTQGVVGGFILLFAAGVFALFREGDEPRWGRRARSDRQSPAEVSRLQAGDA